MPVVKFSPLWDSRPDLRALQFGYRSQEETLRKSVLSQFPSLTLGVGTANDTTNTIPVTNYAP